MTWGQGVVIEDTIHFIWVIIIIIIIIIKDISKLKAWDIWVLINLPNYLMNNHILLFIFFVLNMATILVALDRERKRGQQIHL